MNRNLFSLAISICSIFAFANMCFAQSKPFAQIDAKAFSPHTSVFLLKMDQMQQRGQIITRTDSALFADYDLREFASEWYIGSFIVVDDSFNETEVRNIGVKINTHRSDILTAYIPIKQLRHLRELKGIRQIEIGTKAFSNLDSARMSIGVDKIYNGIALPQAFRGEGVIAATIDIGLDFTCPNFFKKGTTTTRLKKIWDQNTTASSPSGFDYGRELRTQSAIIAAQTDNIAYDHASHVVGIEAGCGGNDTTYRGVAPESDIYFVGTTMFNNTIADGIDYLFTQAEQDGKPCVINMSIGGNIGPRDGTSAFDSYCENEVGEGKILVGAAGNNGNDYLHIGKTFTTMDSVSSFCLMQKATHSSRNNGETVVDIWGNDTASNMQVSVYLYNTQTNQVVDYTPALASNASSAVTYHLIGGNGDTCVVYMAGNISALNHKHNLYVYVNNTANNTQDEYVMISLKSSNNHVNMWGYELDFSSMNKSFAINGDTTMTITEIGGSGNSIITVGSYMSKKSWTSMQGENYNYNSYVLNNISGFSSVGPRSDGVIKPDVTAPGQVIVSSVNSFSDDYGMNNIYVVDTINNGAKTWYYAIMQGTSMASPMVSGIVALLLQQYPKLTPEQAKQLLKENALQDSFTGIITSAGSSTWGWGKANAYNSLVSLIAKIPQTPSVMPNINVTLCQGDSIYAPLSYVEYLWNNGATTRAFAVQVSGYYKVKVKNMEGYWSEYSDSIYVNVAPSYDTIINATVCDGQTYDLHGFSADTTGVYTQTLQTVNGCDSIITLNLTCSNGLNDVQYTYLISFYPNPTKGKTQIIVEGLKDRAEIIIYDIQGKELLRSTLNKDVNGTTINVEDFAKGVYNVVVRTKTNCITKKLIVQ